MNAQSVQEDDATFAIRENLRLIAKQFAEGAIEPGNIDVPAFPFAIMSDASISVCRQKWTGWASDLSSLIGGRTIVVSSYSCALLRSHIAATKGAPFYLSLSIR